MVTNTRSSLLVLSLVGVLSNTGCIAPAVVGGDDGALTGAGTPHAFAIHHAPDATTLWVTISTFALSCDNLDNASGDDQDACPVGWTLGFALPAASQTPGMYSLSDPAIQSNETRLLGADANNGSCVAGGGGNFKGTLEVLSIDASTIKVRLSGLNSDGDLPPADGEYDVVVCQ